MPPKIARGIRSHARERCELRSTLRIAPQGATASADFVTAFNDLGAIEEGSCAARRRQSRAGHVPIVWHVICSRNTDELAARVPHPVGWLVQELPPAREKSARDTAG